MTTPDSTPKVPKWRLLGLKLKYAKDTADEPPIQPQAISCSPLLPQPPAAHDLEQQQKRRLQAIDLSAPETPVKRSRSNRQQYPVALAEAEERSSLPAPTGVFKAPNQKPKRTVFGDDESPIPAQATPQQARQANPTLIRKSVSFTPDTKTEDADSTSDFYRMYNFPTSSPDEEPAEEQPVQPASPPPETEADVSKKPKTTKKEKKSKEAKSPKVAKQSTTDPVAENLSGKPPIYLEYLEKFCSDKGNWKFNKNSQNDLFKHLFHIHRIPAQHTPAIVEYIRGLKGQARQRVGEQAEDVLQVIWVSENQGADPMSLDSAAARRAAYYSALHRSIETYKQSGATRTQYSDQQLKQILEEHERGKRAEAILEQALDGELFPERKPTPTVTATTRPTPASPHIPGATRVVETSQIGRQTIKTETKVERDAKPKRKRKSRTDVSSSSDSSSSSDTSDGGESDSDEAKKGSKASFRKSNTVLTKMAPPQKKRASQSTF